MDTSYRAAYAQLSRIAAELDNGEADLDRVLLLLGEARAAYAACQERIAAVRTVLGTPEWAAGGGEGPEEQAAEEDPEDAEDPF